MARLFNALVVAGAAVSAAACAGKSTSSDADDAGAGGTAGTAGGGAGASNGGTSGSSANDGGILPTGGTPPTGGTAGVTGLPEPDSKAQWNCENLVTDRNCVNVLGTTATPIPKSCPVEPERPRSSADCAPSERFRCILAVTPSSELTLVNCACEPADYGCGCSNLGQLHGEPAYCDDQRKVCACAYTGILR